MALAGRGLHGVKIMNCHKERGRNPNRKSVEMKVALLLVQLFYSYSYGWQRQSESLTPYAINNALVARDSMWTQFTKVHVRGETTFDPEIAVRNLGPMQSTSMPFYQFLLSSIMPLPRQIRKAFVYHRDRLLRPNKRQMVLVDPSAVKGRFDLLLRMLVAHRLCMLSVKVHQPPTFVTSFDVRLFAKRWGPQMEGWQLIHYHQAGNRNGYVVYDNPETDTLAIIFRPYIDNNVLREHARGFLADPEAYSSATDFKVIHLANGTGEMQLLTIRSSSKLHSDDDDDDDDGRSVVRVHPAIYREYLAMEFDLLQFLQRYERRPFAQRRSNLLLAGRSAAGVYSQFFSIRASLAPTPAIHLFKRKHVYSCNAPPVISADSAHAEIMQAINAAGWRHSRVVSDDFCAVFWMGSPLTAEYVADYRHLGDAVHLTDDRSILPEGIYRAVTILQRQRENFPDRCFAHTSVPSIQQLTAVTRYEWWWFWKKARYHILGMHLMVEFIWDALKKRFQVTDGRLYELAFIK
jgi:hypothetical protein